MAAAAGPLSEPFHHDRRRAVCGRAIPELADVAATPARDSAPTHDGAGVRPTRRDRNDAAGQARDVDRGAVGRQRAVPELAFAVLAPAFDAPPACERAGVAPSGVGGAMSLTPAEIAVTPLARPATSTGVPLSIVEPFPSWPPPLNPQHLTPPALVRAQVWVLPAAIAVTPMARPARSTGVALPIVEPFPSCPLTFQPQHLTAPAFMSAHVWAKPAAIALTLLGRPETSTGVEVVFDEPLPSWPSPFQPQHLTARPVKAHRRGTRQPRSRSHHWRGQRR